MYRWGFGVQMCILTYVLIVVISSILIGTKFSFWVTLALSICGLILSHLQINSIILPNWYFKFDIEHHLAEEVSFMLFLIMTISWLSNREIEKSLQRARRSERELKLERDSLEIKVEERTRDLKQVQLEKMSQLYRFAEFGKLSSGLFHDLMNPLTAVALNIGNLKKESLGAENVISSLDKAISASKKMEQYIHTIQKQIGAKDELKTFSLNEEIETVIELLNFKARRSHLEIEFSAEKNHTLFGDSLKFSQIILNLLSNAIDAYENTENSPLLIHISISERNKIIIVKMTDNGNGVSEEIQTKIFDPFFTTKLNAEETGLGLSTSKTIIEKDFGGAITITSTENIGSLVTLKIPVIRAKEQ